ncbi:L,D-transpeptidase family protein [Thermodesulfatator atlanticus]|uniref:L,D-transpeptidase family protein n=1 Tax=Thermodesulfatator atlanticus TaxID=501497 RepID=UPI0003B5D8D8|nr:L,D-transpeptidase [Thermodesulfatator atlanticus]
MIKNFLKIGVVSLIFFIFAEIPAFSQKIIVIEKYSRTLYLYENGHILKAYPVSLGWNPEEPKREQGDGATPEGLYFIREKRPSRRYGLFLALSYPNLKDINLARWEGRLNLSEYEQCVLNFKQGVSNGNCKLGYGLGIHGGGVWRKKNGRLVRDWTYGCVALNDKDMRELYELIEVGTPVLIYDAEKPLFEVFKQLVFNPSTGNLYPWWGEWQLPLKGLTLRVSLWEDHNGTKKLRIWGMDNNTKRLFFLFEDANADGRISLWENEQNFALPGWDFQKIRNMILDMLPKWVEEKKFSGQGG